MNKDNIIRDKIGEGFLYVPARDSSEYKDFGSRKYEVFKVNNLKGRLSPQQKENVKKSLKL